MRPYFPRFSSAALIPAKPANDNFHGGNVPPQGPRPVTQLTDTELANLERNHIAKGVIVGPHYTLHQIRHEIIRREALGFDGATVVRTILQLCAASPDLLTPYKDLHNALWPTEVWNGHASVNKMKKALGAAILYCNDNDMPTITALVVRSGDRQLSGDAVNAIYATCERLGQDVGDSADDFVLRNAIAAMDLVQTNQNAA